jgi:hypothetical protein
MSVWEAIENRLAHHRKEIKTLEQVIEVDRKQIHRQSSTVSMGPKVLEGYVARAYQHDAQVAVHEAAIRELEALLLMRAEA